MSHSLRQRLCINYVVLRRVRALPSCQAHRFCLHLTGASWICTHSRTAPFLQVMRKPKIEMIQRCRKLRPRRKADMRYE